MALAEIESCSTSVVVKRFLSFPISTQYAVLRQVRNTVFSEGFFPQVPTAEWLRLLRLTDPLIHYTLGSEAPQYQVEEGRQVLLLLVGHYLDVY